MAYPTFSEVKIIPQKKFFSSIWGNFVLCGRALLLLFLLHCCRMRVNVSKYQVHQLITIALHIERSLWMLLCFPNLCSSFHVKFFFLANNFKQFAQTKLHVLISTARVKCLMCRRLMGTFIGGGSNIFRGKNHTTKIVFFLNLG